MPRGAVRCSNAHVLLCTLRFCAAILASIRLTKSILWKLAMENLSELEKILGYEFKNKHLLQQAVTHSSHTARLSENYERLEFLGDRVLGVSIASLLYRMFPNEPEGSPSFCTEGNGSSEAESSNGIINELLNLRSGWIFSGFYPEKILRCFPHILSLHKQNIAGNGNTHAVLL